MRAAPSRAGPGPGGGGGGPVTSAGSRDDDKTDDGAGPEPWAVEEGRSRAWRRPIHQPQNLEWNTNLTRIKRNSRIYRLRCIDLIFKEHDSEYQHIANYHSRYINRDM